VCSCLAIWVTSRVVPAWTQILWSETRSGPLRSAWRLSGCLTSGWIKGWCSGSCRCQNSPMQGGQYTMSHYPSSRDRHTVCVSVCLIQTFSVALGLGPAAGSCENGNEASGSIKLGVFIDHLSDYQLLNLASAPWSFFKACLIILNRNYNFNKFVFNVGLMPYLSYLCYLTTQLQLQRLNGD
jgi:hypothetical protein